jgi:hypothetical protein
MERKIAYPRIWCGDICTNAMNEQCVTHCAVRRDTSCFKPKEMTLAEAPPFPMYEFNNEMNATERQKCAGFYLGKVVDYLQGRQVSYRTRTNNGKVAT